MLLQRQSPSLRPMITAHLAQTMTLLGLTTAELRQRIETELAANPALELVEVRRCPTCRRALMDNGPCPFCTRPQNNGAEQPILFLSARQDFHQGGTTFGEDLPDDNLAPEIDDLPTYVMRQVATELSPEDRPLAAHILSCLDEDGLLSTSPFEIARYHHVTLAHIEEILHLIQKTEPIGVACSSPQEALLVQLEVLSETRSVPALAMAAVQQGMHLLSRHRYHELGQVLGVTANEAKAVADWISDNLNPFPARAHWGDIRQSAAPHPDVYHFPDAIITKMNDKDESPLVIEVIIPLAGRLRVNPLFREALQQAPPEKLEQWKNDIERASLLVKCLGQRNHTFSRLMERLAILQRNFILHGEAHLQPITRARIARELELHESTISRAVSDKTAQLPTGRIIPLAMFFDRSLQVRTALKLLISQEASTTLSDSDLADLLKRQGYPVARRTVAKYRAMEGILPAHLRHHMRA